MTAPFIQVINLDGSDDRLAAARAQLEAQGLAFTRSPAFDGRGLPMEDLPRYSAFRARLWFGRPLTGGEVGCFLSHRACAERFLATDAAVGLVLEDDLRLCDDFALKLDALVAALGSGTAPGWRLVNLGRSLKPGQDRHAVAHLPGQVSLCQGADFPLSTHGLLWSRPGAERFLQAAQWVTGTIDNWLRSDMSVHGGGLFTDPPLVLAGGESLINLERGAAEIQQSDGPRRGWYALRSRQRSRWRRTFGARHLARIRRLDQFPLA